MKNDLLYTLALSYVPGIGNINHKKLIQNFDSAQNVWNLSMKEKRNISGISEKVAKNIGNKDYISLANAELEIAEKQQINVYDRQDKAYSNLLKECVDAPAVLFAKGKVLLNQNKYVAVVGTRKMSSLGRSFIQKLISELKDYPITIVSGLAFGVDVTAHLASLENHLPTIGVMAHGLNRIYPSTHQKIGEEMQGNGGLVSEFSSFMHPAPENFLKRNRIIAGLCHATIVIESKIAGGAMSTARHANAYNRDVFAVPGRPGDELSSGCHYLIKNHQAFLLTEGADVLKYLGLAKNKKQQVQKELFVDLTESQQIIYDCLKKQKALHIDEISSFTHWPTFKIMPILLDLELKNLIKPLPGKKYEIQ